MKYLHARKYLNSLALIIVMIVFIVLSGCGKQKMVSVSGIYFDTYVSLTAYDGTDENVLRRALVECERYERTFSKTHPESELYALNNRFNGDSSYISENLYNVISEALYYSEITDGAYNPALGTVIELWDYHSENPSVPDEETIDEALKHTNPADIKLETVNEDGETHYRITINDEKLIIDLGGIAKGYIANCMRDFLIEQGCKEGIIALGGNIYCIGNKSGEGYTVGIQKPFGYQGESAFTVQAANTSVVTSGIYERYFEENDTIYHHIIDSSSGYPVQNNLAAVTVMCDDSMKADVLSTALLCIGPDKASELAENMNVKAIMITRSGERIDVE